MKLKTIPGIVKEIKSLDSSTAVSESFLKALIKEGKFQFTYHGNRMVMDMDYVIPTLNQLFGFNGSETLPHIRTIRKAVKELKKQNSEIGIGEKLVRNAVSLKIIPCICIGNREYISMQSFEEPYCKKIFGSTYARPSRTEMVRNDALEQMTRVLSANPTVPTVRRINKVG